MPEGPNGGTRPADAIGLAVMIGKIATGKIEDARETSSAATKLGSLGGKKRAANMTPERRAEIANAAVDNVMVYQEYLLGSNKHFW